MKSTDARSRKSLISFGVSALLALGAATAQIATAAGTGIDASGSYQSEVQACLSGNTQQDRADCLKEARNAQAEKQRGRLEAYGNHESHAMQRCEVHRIAEDRAACRARIMGMGGTDGSVAGGGLLRESETVILPSGQHSVTIEPQTSSEPIVLVPSTNVLGAGSR